MPKVTLQYLPGIMLPRLSLLSLLLVAVGAATTLSPLARRQATDNANDGFQGTPVMGYNTYNAIACTLNQTWMASTINQFASMGFGSAGYKYMQIDCGWAAKNRQANGSIAYDTSNFPDGIAPLSKLAISKGFKWSMYTDEGVYACDTGATRAGSKGYEKQDAAQFAGWNVAYMKVDNCYVTADADAPHNARSDFVSRYTNMSVALRQYGILGMLVCQWGLPYITPSGALQGPAQWTPQLATSFRVSDDIAQGWSNVQRIYNEAINVNLRGLSGPGHWADMDLLEVGNPGMTYDQQVSHFAIWAMFKSALMVSTVLPSLTASETALLQNKGLIAINQDSLGKPVILRQRYTNDNDQYYGPLANGDLAVLLVDTSAKARSLTLNLFQYNISTATVTDLLSGKVATNVASYTVNVQPNGCLAVRLSNIVYAKPSTPSYTYIAATSGTLAGGAVVQSCSGCVTNVGYVGNGGTVTFSGISTSASEQDILVDYINCDIGYLGGGSYANVRGAGFIVNGGPVQPVLFPITGYNWNTDQLTGFRVHLSGFQAGSSKNTVQIAGLSGTTTYAPNFVSIAIVA